MRAIEQQPFLFFFFFCGNQKSLKIIVVLMVIGRLKQASPSVQNTRFFYQNIFYKKVKIKIYTKIQNILTLDVPGFSLFLDVVICQKTQLYTKGALVATLLGTHLRIQVHKKAKFLGRYISFSAVKGLRTQFVKTNVKTNLEHVS